MDRLLTVKETAYVLGTTRARVMGLIKAGHIKALKIGSLKIRESSLDKFLQDFDGKDVTDPEHVTDLIF